MYVDPHPVGTKTEGEDIAADSLAPEEPHPTSEITPPSKPEPAEVAQPATSPAKASTSRPRQPATPSRRIPPNLFTASPAKNPPASTSPRKVSGTVGTKTSAVLDPKFRFNPFLPATPARPTQPKVLGSAKPPVLVSAKKPIQNLAGPSGTSQTPLRPKPIPFRLMETMSPERSSPVRNGGREVGGSLHPETPRRLHPLPSHMSALKSAPSSSRKRARDEDVQTSPVRASSSAVAFHTPSPHKRSRFMSSPDTDGLTEVYREMQEIAGMDDDNPVSPTRPVAQASAVRASAARLAASAHHDIQRSPSKTDSRRDAPAIDLKARAPQTRFTRPRPGASGASRPYIRPGASSPRRPTAPSGAPLARPRPLDARPTFGSPTRPTSRPIPVPSSSPTRPTHLSSSLSRFASSPSKPSLPNGSSSPVRRQPVPTASSCRNRATLSNENIFQTGPSTLPPVVPRPPPATGTARPTAGANQARRAGPGTSSVAERPPAPPAAARPSGIPLPRTSMVPRPVSRLPRPSVVLSKALGSSTASKQFAFGAGESSAFAPMNINVNMVQVASAPGDPLASKVHLSFHTIKGKYLKSAFFYRWKCLPMSSPRSR